ncbi:MAG: aminopeptidase P N-terminal domain-containing protein [Anaerolineae bacterium]|nr:aminopeptidase P N-terminal domain-containing protein [Gemmatimonadaceae bacterium]
MLLRFMLPVFGVLLSADSTPAQIPQSEYAARRAAVAGKMQDGVLLAFGAAEPQHDYLSFYQGPRFMYLTGVEEAGAALIIVKRGSVIDATVLVQPRDPATETWTGTRLGVDGAARLTGLRSRTIDALEPMLDSLAASGLPLFVVSDLVSSETEVSADQQFVQALMRERPGLRVQNVGALVDQARGKKSAAELALIRKAVEITVLAHREALRSMAADKHEYEIQAVVEYTFRRNGADRPSFATIIGSGPNSTTLHYNVNDRQMRAGEVVVMDIGASYQGYAADVTRTLPVSGTFTPEQRQIYQLVRDAQSAAERQAKAGNARNSMSDSSNSVLARGLARLGLIESAEATYDCGEGQQCPQLGLFYMHGLGHGIGLEVHDPQGGARIATGDAFTIEPGIYVRSDVLGVIPDTPRNRAMRQKLQPAVEKYRNVGVRIEDDYIVTDKGVEWISRAPRELSEIETAGTQP